MDVSRTKKATLNSDSGNQTAV